MEKATCKHCGKGGKGNWRILAIVTMLIGSGAAAATRVEMVVQCVKCGLRFLHIAIP